MSAVTRITVSQDMRRAAELRDAVERLESSELSISSVATLCKRVIDVADRLDPPLRLVQDRHLLADIDAADGRRLGVHSRVEGGNRG